MASPIWVSEFCHVYTTLRKLYVFISFQFEWHMIVVTVFLSILNQMEFHLVQNRKENCQHDHIPFNVKGNGNRVLSRRQLYDESFQERWYTRCSISDLLSYPLIIVVKETSKSSLIITENILHFLWTWTTFKSRGKWIYLLLELSSFTTI